MIDNFVKILCTIFSMYRFP